MDHDVVSISVDGGKGKGRQGTFYRGWAIRAKLIILKVGFEMTSRDAFEFVAIRSIVHTKVETIKVEFTACRDCNGLSCT